MKKPFVTKKTQNLLSKNKYAFVFSLIFIFLLSSLFTIKFIVKAQNGIVTIQPGTLITATSCLDEKMDRVPAKCKAYGGCINYTYTYDQYDPEQDPYRNPTTYVDYNFSLEVEVWGWCSLSPVKNTVQAYGTFSQNVLTGQGDAIIQLTGKPRYQISNSAGCVQGSYTETRMDYTNDACPKRPTGGGGSCLSGVTSSGAKFDENNSSNICSPCNPSQEELDACFYSGGTYDWNYCFCGQSPIVIDTSGDGFSLTSVANGVRFDLKGDGLQKQIAWTSPESDDAWLVLDRNGNGLIDNGTELFGNNTPQPAAPEGKQRNGFLALAEYDKAENGGNSDGVISNLDTIFSNLRLWQDINYNGVSESSELYSLPLLNVAGIELDYKESKKMDEFGNKFRYRAKVLDTKNKLKNNSFAGSSKAGRWAWDVFLTSAD